MAIRKANIPIKFIKINEKRFEFFNETRPVFRHCLLSHIKHITPLRNLTAQDSFLLTGRNPFTSSEVSLRLRFAYLEKFLENTFFRTSLGSPYPIGEIYIAKGISGILKAIMIIQKFPAVFPII